MEVPDNAVKKLDTALTGRDQRKLIFLTLGLVTRSEAGFLRGILAANYSKTGNVWGGIDK
jgi:hypothetical protein